MPNIETINPEIFDTTQDLTDFSWIEKTKEWVDISKKMEGLLDRTSDKVDEEEWRKQEELIGSVWERFWFLVEGKEDKDNLLAFLDTQLLGDN